MIQDHRFQNPKSKADGLDTKNTNSKFHQVLPNEFGINNRRAEFSAYFFTGDFSATTFPL